MAVGLILDYRGGTLAQYDRISEMMPGGREGAGVIFHWVAATDDGVRVVDVWEDRATFDKFDEETLGPFSADVGIPQPEITEYEVHKMLAP
jgi:NAD dependent epimerase/dehydratase family enzyme